jgi:hypothetical protein
MGQKKLAASIPQLSASLREKAREALVKRMRRMSAGTLTDKLEDESAEIRRAAILACAQKDSRDHVCLIINLLADPEPLVSQAAYASRRAAS